MNKQIKSFVTGFLIVTPLDALHVSANILRYSKPYFRLTKQAWWVPFLFGSAATFFTSLWKEKQNKNFYFNLMLFVSCYGITALHFLSEKQKFILLAGPSFYLLRNGTKSERWHSLICSLVGTMGELLLIKLKFFCYLSAQKRPVPIWLFLLYIQASAVCRCF